MTTYCYGSCNVPKGRVARSPTHLAHPLQDKPAVVNHVIGPSLQGQRQDCGELGRLLPVDIPGRDLVVVTTCRLGTIDARTPFDHVQVQLQYAPLAEDQFGHRDQRELGALAEDRAARSEEQVLYQLLGNGGSSANTSAFHIVFSSNLDRVPIKPMML